MEKQKGGTIHLSRLIFPILKNWILVLIAFLSVFITVIVVTYSRSPVYEASAIIIINRGGNLSGEMFDYPVAFMQRYLIKNQVAILESRQLASNVIRKMTQSVYSDSLELFKGDEQDKYASFQVLNNRFRNATSISYSVEDDVIELKGKASSPWEAAYIVNTWVDAYQDYDRTNTHGEVIETKQFLEEKLKDIENKLADSENALAAYQKKQNVVLLPKETEQLVTQLASFESLYNQTKAELEAIENELNYLNNQLDENRKNLVDNMVNMSNPVLQELQRQMAELVTEKAAYEAQLMGAGYETKGDSKLMQMENRLRGVKERVVEETKKIVRRDLGTISPLDHSEMLITQILKLKTTQESLVAKENALKMVVDEYSQKLSYLPDKNRELVRLEREVQVNTKIYFMVREKYEEARIQESGQVGLIRVVDRAVPPRNAVSPKVKLNLILGVFFGLLLGICVTFIREYFADTINGLGELERLGIKVLGTIPSYKSYRFDFKDFLNTKYFFSLKHVKYIYQKKDFPHLITNQDEQPEFAEAHRSVRTSLSFQRHANKTKTILITSPGPSEGKSTTVANLAIANAQKGAKTLMIDSDLRKPVLRTYFSTSKRNSGFSDFLERNISWRKALVKTDIRNLFLIPSGEERDDASELLSVKKLPAFIREIKRTYECIFFDSPPMLPVTDSTLLASLVDGVILVVRVGKTSREAITRSIELIENANANFLGSVLVGSQDYKIYKYREYYRTYGKQKEDLHLKVVVGGKSR